jgi:hypothetical protein
LESADIVQFRSWLLENKTRDLARRTLSGFHSILIEMKQQGFMRNDPAAGITVRNVGRREDFDSEVEIPSDAEMRDILQAAETLRHKNKQMEKVGAASNRCSTSPLFQECAHQSIEACRGPISKRTGCMSASAPTMQA